VRFAYDRIGGAFRARQDRWCVSRTAVLVVRFACGRMGGAFRVRQDGWCVSRAAGGGAFRVRQDRSDEVSWWNKGVHSSAELKCTSNRAETM